VPVGTCRRLSCMSPMVCARTTTYWLMGEPGPPEESRGGPTNYSDADYDDLVPLDCGSGRPPRLGGGFGAGPINNRDADALDFLPSTPTSPRSRHARRAARVARSTIQTGLARNGSACQSTDGVGAF